jgi:hypothetical protein
MSGISDQCLLCARHRGNGTCPAFPDGIPHEIWGGEFDHSEPWPGGDNGFQFVEWVEGKDSSKLQYPPDGFPS